MTNDESDPVKIKMPTRISNIPAEVMSINQPDIAAVSALRPSYMHQTFDHYFNEMPRGKGFALIIDDNTEKIWMIKVRPRFSWDAGVTASAFLK